MRSPSRSRPRNGSRESNQRPKLTSQPRRPPPTGPAASIGPRWFARPAPKRAIWSDYYRELVKRSCKSRVCATRIRRPREALLLPRKSFYENPCDRARVGVVRQALRVQALACRFVDSNLKVEL